MRTLGFVFLLDLIQVLALLSGLASIGAGLLFLASRTSPQLIAAWHPLSAYRSPGTVGLALAASALGYLLEKLRGYPVGRLALASLATNLVALATLAFR
jgi:hypothetical protein